MPRLRLRPLEQAARSRQSRSTPSKSVPGCSAWTGRGAGCSKQPLGPCWLTPVGTKPVLGGIGVATGLENTLPVSCRTEPGSCMRSCWDSVPASTFMHVAGCSAPAAYHALPTNRHAGVHGAVLLHSLGNAEQETFAGCADVPGLMACMDARGKNESALLHSLARAFHLPLPGQEMVGAPARLPARVDDMFARKESLSER